MEPAFERISSMGSALVPGLSLFTRQAGWFVGLFA